MIEDLSNASPDSDIVNAEISPKCITLSNSIYNYRKRKLSKQPSLHTNKKVRFSEAISVREYEVQEEAFGYPAFLLFDISGFDP